MSDIKATSRKNKKRKPLTAEQRERQKATSVAWTKANPDRTKEIRDQSYAKHREQNIADMRMYKLTHKEVMRSYKERTREVRKVNNKAWREANREVLSVKTRERVLARYGLTIETWTLLLAEQGGCALCGAIDPGKSGWATDHDHVLGHEAVRGILCAHCNMTLGRVGDSVDAVRQWCAKAISYLEITAPMVTPLRIAKAKASK